MKRLFLSILLSSFVLVLNIQMATAGTLYVTNPNPTNPPANIVSVIDTAMNRVNAIITVGDHPHGVTFSPDESEAYVANYSDNTISVIETSSHSVTATINVGRGPQNIAFSSISPAGVKAYVTNSIDNTVSVIDTSNHTVITTVNVGRNPYAIAVSPDGARVYVANVGSGPNTVSVIDIATDTVTATVDVGENPVGIAISPLTLTGYKVYVTNEFSNSVSVIDSATNSVIATISGVGSDNRGWLTGVTISPDGAKLYVVATGDDNLVVIDTATNTITTRVRVGKWPSDVVLSSDGRSAYVTNMHSRSVSVIDTSLNIVTTTLSGLIGPSGIAFANITPPPPPPPTAIFSRSSLSFPRTIVDRSSSPQTVQVTNNGFLPLAIFGISISGDFSETNDCGNSLNPGSTCTISVIFNPLSVGSITGILTMNDNALGSPHTVRLSGTGAENPACRKIPTPPGCD